MTQVAGWLNASSRTEEAEPVRHCSLSLVSHMGKRRGFQLSARQGCGRELLLSGSLGATWGTTRGAISPAWHVGHPLGTGSKSPSAASWSMFRVHWRQGNTLGSCRVRFLSSTLSCTRALQALQDHRTMESKWFESVGTFKNHLIPTLPHGQGHLPFNLVWSPI